MHLTTVYLSNNQQSTSPQLAAVDVLNIFQEEWFYIFQGDKMFSLGNICLLEMLYKLSNTCLLLEDYIETFYAHHMSFLCFPPD